MFDFSAVSLADWLGIAGFVLSLSLAAVEWRRQHAALTVSVPELCPLSMRRDKGHLLFRCALVNRSSLPISVYDVSLRPRGVSQLLYPIRDECIPLASSRDSTVEPMLSTPLPITLAPYESQDIALVFPYDWPLLPQSFHRLAADNLPGSVSVPDLEPIRLRLRLDTSRRRVVRSISAKPQARAILLCRLSARLEMRS